MRRWIGCALLLTAACGDTKGEAAAAKPSPAPAASAKADASSETKPAKDGGEAKAAKGGGDDQTRCMNLCGKLATCGLETMKAAAGDRWSDEAEAEAKKQQDAGKKECEATCTPEALAKTTDGDRTLLTQVEECFEENCSKMERCVKMLERMATAQKEREAVDAE